MTTRHNRWRGFEAPTPEEISANPDAYYVTDKIAEVYNVTTSEGTTTIVESHTKDGRYKVIERVEPGRRTVLDNWREEEEKQCIPQLANWLAEKSKTMTPEEIAKEVEQGAYPCEPPCRVTPEGQALWKELSSLCGDLCLVEWSARIAIESALLREAH